MIILNTNYETINIVAVEKIDIYCTNMFLLPPIIDTIIL